MRRVFLKWRLVFIHLLTYAVFMYFFFSYTRNSVGSGSFKEVRAEWIAQQAERLQRIDTMCSSYNEGAGSYEQILKDEKLLKVLIYNDDHKVIYCAIPKIASTNWKRIFTTLNGLVNEVDPVKIDHHFVHNLRGEKSMALFKLPAEEQLKRLRTYNKFLFVRHPFERLLSAYKDKLRGSSNDSIQNFQKTYGAKMLKFVRPHEDEAVIKRGGDLTFREFAKYLTHSEDPLRLNEPHWKPMNDICHPCKVNYNFVGKYETLLRDVRMILDETGIELPFSFPPKDKPNSRTKDELKDFMEDFSIKDIWDLFQTYKKDFELFGYEYTD